MDPSSIVAPKIELHPHSFFLSSATRVLLLETMQQTLQAVRFFQKLVLVPFKVIHLFSHWSLSYVHFCLIRVLGAAIKQPIHHRPGIGYKRLTGTDFLEMEKILVINGAGLLEFTFELMTSIYHFTNIMFWAPV